MGAPGTWGVLNFAPGLLTLLQGGEAATACSTGLFSTINTSGPNSGPLGFAQMFFATDTNQLYFGTPGIGIGYILIGDTTGMNETLLQVLSELRCMRLALTQIACEGGLAVPSDFDPKSVSTDTEMADQQQI